MSARNSPTNRYSPRDVFGGLLQTSMSAETERISADTIRSARIRGPATTAPAPVDTDPKEWGAPASVRSRNAADCACLKLLVAQLTLPAACQASQKTVGAASSLLPVCLPSSARQSITFSSAVAAYVSKMQRMKCPSNSAVNRSDKVGIHDSWFSPVPDWGQLRRAEDGTAKDGSQSVN